MKKTNSKKDEKPKKVADVSAKNVGDDPQLPPPRQMINSSNKKK